MLETPGIYELPASALATAAVSAAALLLFAAYWTTLSQAAVFAYACFLKPFLAPKSSSDHQSNLEAFYKAQASIYDATREPLLKGRATALKLAFSHLPKRKNLVWVDIGGGTGSNLEKMHREVVPLTHFAAVYLVDLSPSLCAVARDRVARNDWKNVYIVCSDACDFEIPAAAKAKADLVTFSYSLSMIPPYYAAVDRAEKLLRDSESVIGVVDFGVQTSAAAVGRESTLGGTAQRHVSWVCRTFWRLWFECDKVFLDPSRREYLEHKFGTLKSLNLYNRGLGNIPYYIWLGCRKDRTTTSLTTADAENLKKGLPFSLFELGGKDYADVEFAYNRKEKKDHGEGGNLVGPNLAGKSVLIVDDVMTAGTAINEAYDILQGAGAKWRPKE